MFFLLLRTKAVFFIGFIIGSILPLLLMFAEGFTSIKTVCNVRANDLLKGTDEFDKYIALERSVNDNLSKETYRWAYNNWLWHHNVEISRVNLDELVYGIRRGSTAKRIQRLEANWLKSKVHITCVVFVEKIKLAESIRDTWASHCNEIYYFGAEKEDVNIPVINFGIKLTSSWQFLCESMNYIWQKHLNETEKSGRDDENRIEWLVFVKDDTMVIPENLRYLVAPMDFEKGYYLGHAVTLWGQSYNMAQAGYVLSKGALVKMVTTFNTREKCATGGKYWKKEDYDLGKNLATVGIHPLDTRDEDLSGTFHGYSLQIILLGAAKSGNYWTHAVYPVGPNCCSSKSVTFSVGEPDKMYAFYYMLYRLNIYQDDGAYGNEPAATVIPDEEMWKIVLKEEFNITNLAQISSQHYYQIWRDRYSEPEQFIMNNNKNMPDVFSSLLQRMKLKKNWTELRHQ